MAFPARKRIYTDDYELNEIQDSLGSVVDRVAACPLVDGVHVRDARLIAGVVTTINHKLGRPLIGWIVTDKDQDANIWRDESDNPSPHLTLRLFTNLDTTCSIWCF